MGTRPELFRRQTGGRPSTCRRSCVFPAENPAPVRAAPGKGGSRRVFHDQLDPPLSARSADDPAGSRANVPGSSLGVYDLWLLVLAGGGYDKVSSSADFWQEQARSAGGGIEADELKLVYAQYLLPFDQRFSLQPALAKSSSACDASAALTCGVLQHAGRRRRPWSWQPPFTSLRRSAKQEARRSGLRVP